MWRQRAHPGDDSCRPRFVDGNATLTGESHERISADLPKRPVLPKVIGDERAVQHASEPLPHGLGGPEHSLELGPQRREVEQRLVDVEDENLGPRGHFGPMRIPPSMRIVSPFM